MKGFLDAGQCTEERILIVPDNFPKVSDALANATEKILKQQCLMVKT